MTVFNVAQLTREPLIADFFRESEGKWLSQRRYYTLPDGKTDEVERSLYVRFLKPGSPQLQELAQLHQLSDPTVLICGSEICWESTTSLLGRKYASGSTVFGATNDILYRDRGFLNSEPVIATYQFTNPETLCLRTEYNGCVFEEEIKNIGEHYRTRQTIITRSGEQQMIAQYLEKRIE